MLRSTRALSAFIAPFLIVAFVVLYGFPDQTERLFAWTIHPTMTPMVLASAYLGGFYFFVRALWESRWATLRLGLSSVALSATLLGIATVIHWDRFNHQHFASAGTASLDEGPVRAPYIRCAMGSMKR